MKSKVKNENRNINKKEKKTKEKKGFGLSLFSMLTMLSLMPLVLSIAIISVTSLYITRNNLEGEIKNTLHIVANNLASYCVENEITAINAGNYYAYLDSLEEQNIEMAIIADGMPSATSIKNENDYRIREIEFEKDIVTDREELLENGFYDEYVVIDDKVYYGYYVPIVSNGEIRAVAFAGELQENINMAMRSIIVTFATIAILLMVVFAVMALLFSRLLSKSFDTIEKNVNALSQGVLSKQKESKSAIREMNNLLSETGTMQQNLSNTIGKVKNVSQSLVSNVADVTKLSESSADRANQITSVMEELSRSTTGMAENVQDINAQMMEIGNCINDISENVEHLSSSSENIVQTNNEAKINMNAIMENSKRSVDAVTSITTQIKQTNDAIMEIDGAVELILAISEQTSLLSLNASIEAARAGSNGRGFAVVAEEIRRLSEQSAEGAEMIKNLAGEITEKSQKSVGLADQVNSLILQEQESVAKTQQKYEELSRDIDESVIEIKSIAEKTEHLTGYKVKVTDNVQTLNTISHENAASSEKVNSNIREIIAEVQEVNENCVKINGMAGELKESVSYFNE